MNSNEYTYSPAPYMIAYPLAKVSCVQGTVSGRGHVSPPPHEVETSDSMAKIQDCRDPPHSHEVSRFRKASVYKLHSPRRSRVLPASPACRSGR